MTAALRTDTPAALSSDELRALGRVAGTVLPPELLAGWHPEDHPVADTVAVRSLLARGVLQLRAGGAGPALALTGAAGAALAPLLAARALAGVSLLTRAGQERRRLVAESAAGTLLLTEREPDVWTLDPAADPVERVTARLAADLLDEGPRPAPGGARLLLPADTLRLADRLVTEGRETAVPRALTRAGLPAAAAASWAAVLCGRVATGEVRLARRVEDEVFTGGGVRWVDAGPTGVWLVEPVPEEAEDGDGEAGWYALRDAGIPGVRAALDALLGSGPDEGGPTWRR
jgi:hypothetical protein